jgi:hypothetical protein
MRFECIVCAGPLRRTMDHVPEPRANESSDPAYWRAALDRVAHRIAQERGVRDDVDVSSAHEEILWVRYGGLELRVDPHGAVVIDEADLFEQVDEWVAFDRPDGPGRVLQRDRDRVERYRQDLLVMRDRYHVAARLVFADVASSTTLNPRWEIVLHNRPPLPYFPVSSPPGLHPPPPAQLTEESRDQLPDPVLTLICAVGDFDLHDDADTELRALFNMVDAVQDALIEEVHGAWPPCPAHGHPLEVEDGSDGVAVWACPRGAPTVPVGQLVRRPGSAVTEP